MSYPQQPYQPPRYIPPPPARTVTSSGLPIWMHLCYLFLGWIPCFLGWVIWPIHWWFAKSKTVSVAHPAPTSRPPAYPPPPPAQLPHQPYRGYGPPTEGQQRLVRGVDNPPLSKPSNQPKPQPTQRPTAHGYDAETGRHHYPTQP